MPKRSLKNTVVISLNMLIFVFITVFVCVLLRNNFLFSDIMHEGIECNPRLLFFPVHGRFLCGFLTHLIGIVPVLNIHPMFYINTISPVIIGLIYGGICYFMADSVNIFKKEKYLFTPFVFLLCFLLLFLLNLIEIYSHTQFFGYSICLIFLFYGYSQIFKFFTSQKKPENSTKTLCLNTFAAIFIGQSSYMENISFLIVLLLVGLWFLVKFGREASWSFSEIISKFSAGGKAIYVPISAFLLSIFYTYLNIFVGLKFQNYQDVVSSSEFFQNSISGFGTFIKAYQIYLLDLLPYLGVIAFFLILAFFFTKDKKEYIRFCFIDIATVFSLLFFFFSLWILGTTYYNEGCWLRHIGMTLLLKTSLIYLAVCTFGFFIHILPTKDWLKNVIVIVLTTVLLFVLPTTKENRIHFNYKFTEIPEEGKEIRKSFYIVEKMSLTYYFNGKRIYLPESCLKNFPKEYILTDLDDKQVFLSDDYNNKLQTNKQYQNEELHLEKIYFKNVYGIYSLLKVTFVPDEIAYEKFKEAGGTITNDEIEKNDFMYLYKCMKDLKSQS